MHQVASHASEGKFRSEMVGSAASIGPDSKTKIGRDGALRRQRAMQPRNRTSGDLQVRTVPPAECGLGQGSALWPGLQTCLVRSNAPAQDVPVIFGGGGDGLAGGDFASLLLRTP